jgi:hypothetical protein
MSMLPPAGRRSKTTNDFLNAKAAGTLSGRRPRPLLSDFLKLSDYQRAEAIKRRAAGETLASIAKSYAVDISMISRL